MSPSISPNIQDFFAFSFEMLISYIFFNINISVGAVLPGMDAGEGAAAGAAVGATGGALGGLRARRRARR